MIGIKLKNTRNSTVGIKTASTKRCFHRFSSSGLRHVVPSLGEEEGMAAIPLGKRNLLSYGYIEVFIPLHRPLLQDTVGLCFCQG